MQQINGARKKRISHACNVALRKWFFQQTSISLSYSLEENAPYSGVREFQAVLTINPKIFIPEYAVSEYGEAKIENMGIENGKRLMKLIVNGDFPKTGTIAKIVGYPGLSEDTTALMNFDLEKSIFWGGKY